MLKKEKEKEKSKLINKKKTARVHAQANLSPFDDDRQRGLGLISRAYDIVDIILILVLDLVYHIDNVLIDTSSGGSSSSSRCSGCSGGCSSSSSGSGSSRLSRASCSGRWQRCKSNVYKFADHALVQVLKNAVRNRNNIIFVLDVGVQARYVVLGEHFNGVHELNGYKLAHIFFERINLALKILLVKRFNYRVFQ